MNPSFPRPPRAGAALHGGLLLAVLQVATPALAQDALVQRQGPGWQLQAQGQSLTALALALTQASGSRLRGTADILAGAAPLRATRPWQARSLDEAWQLLLDGRVPHARQCSGQGAQQRCTVWLSASPAMAAPDASANDRSATPVRAPRPTLPAALPPAAPPQAPPLADPPGLFPAAPADVG